MCPVCGRMFRDGETVVVVTGARRKNRRGRIAWSRDGICLACAEKEQEEKEHEHSHSDGAAHG